MQKKLTKSATNRSIVGVCGGIAEYFGMSPMAVRLIMIFFPANLLIYIILANTMSEPPRTL
ncbi:PspC domain-containing protein [Halalkalibacter suaedae]|uniref:PspC domain-containing protein n=1 Tax=Halalkalibacter suaedae TaxID=2822140 RepID=A0A940WZF4_9BACI|nr:PspC domain-containing protein [Bacillus suaedae]MBP3951615.1 PspC domain-containing protein [Bacillus suaedae]